MADANAGGARALLPWVLTLLLGILTAGGAGITIGRAIGESHSTSTEHLRALIDSNREGDSRRDSAIAVLEAKLVAIDKKVDEILREVRR